MKSRRCILRIRLSNTQNLSTLRLGCEGELLSWTQMLIGLMSDLGQTEKNSVRANVFRVAPDSGHYSISRHVSKVPISDIDCTAGYVTSADRSSLWPCRDCCGKLSRLPHAELHRVLTKEDDHGNLCRAGEVH